MSFSRVLLFVVLFVSFSLPVPASAEDEPPIVDGQWTDWAIPDSNWTQGGAAKYEHSAEDLGAKACDWAEPDHPEISYEFATLRNPRYRNQGETQTYSVRCTVTSYGNTSVADVLSIERINVCPEGYQKVDVSARGPAACQPNDAMPDKNNGTCPETCDETNQHKNPSNPINAATGNKFETEQDYRNSAEPLLRFTRYFNSLGNPDTHGARKPRYSGVTGRGPSALSYTVGQYDDPTETTAPARRHTRVGRSWTHSYDRSLEIRREGNYPSIRAYRQSGGSLLFLPAAGGWAPQDDIELTLSELPDGRWLLVDTSDRREYYSAAGVLQRIENRAGHGVDLEYDSDGYLAAVRSDFGREMLFEHAGGLVNAVVLPGGERIAFEHDSDEKLTAVIREDGAVRRYEYANALFNDRTLLTAIYDENGDLYARWEYDVDGLAIRSTHGDGANDVQITRDGSTTTMVQGNGQVVTLESEVSHGVWRVVGSSEPCDGCSNVSRVELDETGRILEKENFEGEITRQQFNDRGLRTALIEAVGTPEERTVYTEWHPDFRLPVRITEPGRMTEYGYDSDGNRTSRTVTDLASGESRQTTWTYNEHGQVLTMDGPREDVSDITTYVYDTAGNIAAIRYALGHETRYTAYNAHGKLQEIVDRNGVVTTLEYDARQRLVRRTVAVGTAYAATSTFEYDSFGQLRRTTMPNGASISYEYDSAHRLIAIEDGLGNRIAYELDSEGNRIAQHVSGPSEGITRESFAEYNELNHLVASVGGAGQRSAFETDIEGKRTAMTDALGNRTTMRYDALDRLFETVDALGGITRYDFDPRDNLIQAVDQRGVTTDYIYNGFDELMETRSADAGTAIYEYDAAGNRILHVDARGVETHFEYDALNRLTFIDYPGTEKDISYQYDTGANGVGRLVALVDESGSTQYSYNPRGELVSKDTVVAATPLSVGYDHDAAGNISSISYPNGQVVFYERDSLGRVSGMSVQNLDGTTQQIASDIGYQPFGPVDSLIYGNGLVETRSYDNDGRLLSIRAGTMLDRNYNWDAASNIIAINNAVDGSKSQAFAYDSLYRLVSATGGYGRLEWTYDSVGNRTSETDNGIYNAYGYAADSNRLVDVDGEAIAYDEAGNSLTDGDKSFSYDERNRFVSVSTADGSYGYVHNALGQRVSKPRFETSTGMLCDANGDEIIDQNDLLALHDMIKGRIPSVPAADCNQDGVIDNKDNASIARLIGPAKNNGKNNGKNKGQKKDPVSTAISSYAAQFSIDELGEVAGKVLFVYDEAGHLIGEYDENGEAIKQYVWLGDRPIAVLEQGEVYYIHVDHLNTPQIVTDANQQVAWQGDYSPFGDVDVTENSNIELNLRFPGQYFDAETGLNYNYFRSYNPAMGRYTQSDPIGLADGPNTYIYGYSNAISNSDVLGLWVSRCARELGGPSARATTQNWINPFRHDYLNISGDFLGFGPKEDTAGNLIWGEGKVSSDEIIGKACNMICFDDKFDSYVKEAAAEIGEPNYNLAAFRGLPAHMAGARNCQTWVDDVINLAKEKYIEGEECPSCFK
ncbi:MAG: RHS repeat-associated core domain-containing protein [Gammaproteobacteria bacterium]|nr:RHS repeat-associated core domain-containing protein [Gammaproteobacteria bacterium]